MTDLYQKFGKRLAARLTAIDRVIFLREFQNFVLLAEKVAQKENDVMLLVSLEWDLDSVLNGLKIKDHWRLQAIAGITEQDCKILEQTGLAPDKGRLMQRSYYLNQLGNFFGLSPILIKGIVPHTFPE